MLDPCRDRQGLLQERIERLKAIGAESILILSLENMIR